MSRKPKPSVTTVGAPQPLPPPPTTAATTAATTGGDTKTTNDCNTQPICSISCPQWCGYLLLPPPPPLLLDGGDSASGDGGGGGHVSPLMAALIAVLAAAFLLLCYFTVVSRLFRHRRNRNRRRVNHRTLLPPEARIDSMIRDPAARAENPSGLDEAFIRQITVFTYRRSDGLVEGTDCAVCLGEFKEEEELRLMPNCEHAFHIPCIDTWLKSQSSCPLCRAGMNPDPPLPRTNTEVSVAAMRVERRDDDVVVVVREVEEDDDEVVVCHHHEVVDVGNGGVEMVRKGGE